MTQENFQNTIFILKDEMYRFAKRFVLNHEAEDIVQELMMKLWRKKEQLSQIKNLKIYVLKCVKNECLNRLKHRETTTLKMKNWQATADTIQKEDFNNLKEQIVAFINQLPEKQKLVMHLKDVEECEISEIAEILNMEENAVRVNLMRARKKVKEQIAKLVYYEQQNIGRKI